MPVERVSSLVNEGISPLRRRMIEDMTIPSSACALHRAGGRFAPDGVKWIGCRPGYFLPERVLSRLFRGVLLGKLVAAFEDNRLQFFCGPPNWRRWAHFLPTLPLSGGSIG